MVTWSAHAIKSSLAVSSELVVLSESLRSVLFELEEASRVVVNIGVAKVVKLIAHGVLDIFLHLWSVLLLVLIELSSCCLELVSCGSR